MAAGRAGRQARRVGLGPRRHAAHGPGRCRQRGEGRRRHHCQGPEEGAAQLAGPPDRRRAGGRGRRDSPPEAGSAARRDRELGFTGGRTGNHALTGGDSSDLLSPSPAGLTGRTTGVPMDPAVRGRQQCQA
ncbi:MAG: hypothetical protein EOO25_19045 [Comamonadaceae bacterium]|nr:MAG: hypothetical protein EOO25_19045 [Comamonadaceae bacterium]